MKKLSIVVVMITMVCFVSAAFAQAPQVLNFQGQLNDSSGNPVTDGNYSIDFRIYDADQDGNLVWSSGSQTVAVKDGVFNALLNNVTLDLSSSTYYLTMQVNGDNEMSPRQRITSVVYAMNANTWMRNGNDIYFDNVSGNVGIGTANPEHKLSIVSDATGDMAVHIGEQHNSGGYIGSFNPDELYLYGGAEYVNGSWIARDTEASYVRMLAGSVKFGTDSELIVGEEFTHTDRMSLDTNGTLHITAKNTSPQITLRTSEPAKSTWKIMTGYGFWLSSDDTNMLSIDGTTGLTTVHGTFHVTGGADLAEPFDMTDIDSLELGDVVVIDPQNPLHVTKSVATYDTMVAGIVSSTEQAGYVAGGRSDGSSDKPVALVGRVLCKVSTENGVISVGDLLTTSGTPGHAMKATEKDKMTGALLGKALQAFDGETGMIMVLVALQ